MKKQNYLAFLAATIFSLGVVVPIGYKIGKDIVEKNIEAHADGGEEMKKITISYPQDGQNVTILRREVTEYIKAMYTQAEAIENDYILHDFYVHADPTGSRPGYGTVLSNDTDLVRIDDYWGNSGEYGRSKSVYLVFDSEGLEENAEYTVKYSLNSDLSEATTLVTTDKFVILENLFADQTYYWSVTSGEVSTGIKSFKTNDGFRMISSGQVTNVRDMGGRRVAGGKHIKQGLIYRGSEFVREDYVDTKSGSTHYKSLDEKALNVLQNQLHIGYEFDFRGDEESGLLTESPLKDENYTDVLYERIPNMSGYDGWFSMNDTMKEQFANMLRAFGRAEEDNRVCYFHCWGGADRTGTAGFILGGLLGMSYTDLIIDFELTSFAGNYRPHYKMDSKKIYCFPALIWKFMNRSEYKANPNITISELIEDVLVDKFNMTHEEIAQIKNNLLED